ncbi:MAG TPA: exodeoxyribonuclease III [Candidatus Kaiserbacteria bacterium]|nr:exodeoxyribonuclease III [Candidatus Kaiserbacteria bacterium]
MRIVSWNVNGLRAVARNNNWVPFLQATKPDIFLLQETKASPEQLPDEVRECGGFSSFFSSSQVRKGYSGVALYSKQEPLSVLYGMGIKEFDQEGRIIAGEYEDFWLLGVYFPNGGRGQDRLEYKLRFYDAFLQFIEKLRQQKPVIFCGDVNTAHEEIDLACPKENENNTGFLPEERAWLDEVIRAGYIDTFRDKFPKSTGAYSYWDMRTRARDRNIGWRFDYFFASNEIARRIKSAHIHADVYGSDHAPVSITL